MQSPFLLHRMYELQFMSDGKCFSCGFSCVFCRLLLFLLVVLQLTMFFETMLFISIVTVQRIPSMVFYADLFTSLNFRQAVTTTKITNTEKSSTIAERCNKSWSINHQESIQKIT